MDRISKRFGPTLALDGVSFEACSGQVLAPFAGCEVVMRFAPLVEAEFIGEERPKGLVGRILAPRGGEVFHWDRFILPCIAQVEYRLGDRSHIVTTAALTPRTRNVTDLFATVAVRVPVPHAALRTVFKPVAMRILRQDIEILRRQTEQIEHFGEQDFVSTEIDVLGLRIKKLLREAAAGRESAMQEERRIKMLV